MINAHTKLCGIIGHPVRHTISPAMHNAAITHLGVDYTYLAFDVPSTHLAKAVEGMRALDIAGLNVTIPHKVAVLPLVDELDPLAQNIGAINTIVNQNGKLKGYNTDVAGFIEALRAVGFDASGKSVLLLGTGGAARAMGFALAQQGARISIFSRHASLEQAQLLSQNLNRIAQYPVKALELNDDNLRKVITHAKLLVNATSVGMTPNNTEIPLPSNMLKPGMVVFDVVYTPLETRLLKEARKKGCATVSGLDMLVHQGALAFKLWTGENAPLDVMQRAALAELGVKKPAKTKAKPTTAPKTAVALIGFMGAGKSSVGNALAREIGKPFVDIDQRIEEKTGKSIARIFNEEGEKVFRALEKSAIRNASVGSGNIIACGGGAMLDAQNVAILKKHAVIIYLKSSAVVIKQRLSASRSRRPLLAGENWLDTISKLMLEREPLYAQTADITIESSNNSIADTTKLIMQKLEEYENFNF